MHRILFLLCFFCAEVLAHGAVLNVAIAAHDPAASREPGMMTFNRDLANEICRNIRRQCVTVDMPFKDILPSIAQGKIHMGFGNYLKTPEREAIADFSDSVWRSSSRLVGKPKTQQRFAARLGREVSLESLRDATIVAVQGSRQHAFVESMASDSERNIRLKSVVALTEGVAMLRSGEADFALFVMLVVYPKLNEPAGEKLVFVGPPMIDQGLGGNVHIALSKGDEALRLAVNRALATMRSDGSYHRIVLRSFPFNLD